MQVSQNVDGNEKTIKQEIFLISHVQASASNFAGRVGWLVNTSELLRLCYTQQLEELNQDQRDLMGLPYVAPTSLVLYVAVDREPINRKLLTSISHLSKQVFPKGQENMHWILKSILSNYEALKNS